MFDTFTSRLDLRGTLETLTAIRISAGRSTSPISSDLPVVRDALDRPFIPGSSFKGVLRSYVESLLRGFNVASETPIVCNPTVEDEQCVTASAMNNLRDERQRRQSDVNRRWNDRAFTQQILDKTCWVCHLFGSPWYASKLQLRDLTVQDGFWFGQYQQRDGVAIDRDTETASEGKLYDYEVVPAGVPFKFHAIVDNADPWQLGMLYLGLNAFEQERLTIGGGVSRGLGLVKLTFSEQTYLDSDHLAAHLADPEYRGEPAQRDVWLSAFRERLRNL
jgi:CRISPR-associated RAMP protein (TIGR02581 family)